ncbi:hypothetical protein C5167_031308, partial [Papaver somniferum]
KRHPSGKVLRSFCSVSVHRIMSIPNYSRRSRTLEMSVRGISEWGTQFQVNLHLMLDKVKNVKEASMYAKCNNSHASQLP